MRRHQSRRRPVLGVEPLERRDAPATLVSGNKVTYQDCDGDTVIVTFSKAILTPANVNAVFNFDAGTVDGSNSIKQQLRKIDLTSLEATAKGVAITTAAARSALNGGDGFAAVGQIVATGIDLGAVTIDGDLGRMWVGDDVIATTGVKGLTALSLGRYGIDTGSPDLTSTIGGRLDFLRLKSDLIDAYVFVQGGDIGSVTIGGSLLGGADQYAGRIETTGNIGPITIRGDVVGGSDYASGSIYAIGKIAGATIGGAVRGGTGQSSGTIVATGGLGAVAIGGDIAGGAGEVSGVVGTNGKLAGVTVGGSLRGAGSASGRIYANLAMGPVKIAGDVLGGDGPNSGAIWTYDRLSAVTIRGSILVGAGPVSGSVTGTGGIGVVKITGSVIGGSEYRSGSIASGHSLAGVMISGSLVGGTGQNSGCLFSGGASGAVRISGSMIGGSAYQAGSIIMVTSLASVTIGGSLVGGTSGESGLISAAGAMGPVKIVGDLVGGSANDTESVRDSGTLSARRIASVTIGGSMVAGTDETSGAFYDNGAIRAEDDLGPILIRGSLLGNPTNPVIISARGSATPAGTSDLAIASLTVLGRVEYARIIAGVDSIGSPANADAQIGAVTVGGDWIKSSIAAGANAGGNGYYGDGDDVKMIGVNIKDQAQVFSKIASLSIGGQVIGTAGGTDCFGVVAENVGVVKIGGTPVTLAPGNGNDDLVLGIANDLRINEL
jgi:hypothetical protein